MSTLVLTRLALIAALLLLLLHYAREWQQIKRYALAVTRGQQRPLGAALGAGGSHLFATAHGEGSSVSVAAVATKPGCDTRRRASSGRVLLRSLPVVHHVP